MADGPNSSVKFPSENTCFQYCLNYNGTGTCKGSIVVAYMEKVLCIV